MANPANLFELETPLIARLDELKTAVPTMKTGAAITLMGATNVTRFMPGVFVRPLPATEFELVGYQIQERQRWEVTIALQALADKKQLASTYEALGRLAQRVIVHLHGWTAPDLGTLAYAGRNDIVEMPGHAELTLLFDVPVLIDLADTSSIDDFLRFYPVYDVEDTERSPDAEDHINLPGPGGGTP